MRPLYFENVFVAKSVSAVHQVQHTAKHNFVRPTLSLTYVSRFRMGATERKVSEFSYDRPKGHPTTDRSLPLSLVKKSPRCEAVGD